MARTARHKSSEAAFYHLTDGKGDSLFLWHGRHRSDHHGAGFFGCKDN